MRTASRELLAPRADVWAFIAEPYHLPDWWPGITGVEPDRRGFAPGARWKVITTSRNIFIGRRSRETMLLVRAIDPYERFAWHVLAPKLDAEVSLQAVDVERTRVTVAVSSGSAEQPLQRLYDLVQTAATL
ncbi:MAG TPA: SRPBCC family protein [Gaiellaceae bacterium]